MGGERMVLTGFEVVVGAVGGLFVIILQEESVVEAKKTEMESVSNSESDWMGDRKAGWFLDWVLELDEGQEKLKEALPFFSPRVMVGGICGKMGKVKQNLRERVSHVILKRAS